MIIEQKEIKYKGKVVFERLVLKASFKRLPKLFVENEACFLFLTKGAFHFRTPTNFMTFKEGDGMLAKCGNYFMENVAINEKMEEQHISALGAFFYPAIVKDFFKSDLSISAFQSTFDTLKIDIEPLMKSFIDSLNFMLDHPELADDNLITNKLKELLILLSKTEKASSIHAFVYSLFVPNEYNFKEVISANLYANLSLEEFAHLTNQSLASFKRKFKEYYSESPAKYLLIKRLEKAALLLKIPSEAIADIAFECGFESVSHFDKAFKKHYHKSPTAYRMS